MHKLAQGSKLFFRHSKKSWIVGTLEENPAGDVYTCKDDEGQVEKVKTPDVYYIDAGVLEADVDDLLDLPGLHEATLLVVLNNRYQKDVIYTKIGDLIVALNPFNFKIPWYMDDMMPGYLKEGKVIQRNKPHSWCVAHGAYWRLVDERKDQCILISGESGAGKTEGAKIVVKYLGEMSAFRGGEAQKENSALINKKIIQASPILESFGNAKTVRNDNSSRFGKFMRIQFNKEGILVGAFVTEYLLEKSRVLTAGPNERIYHTFYEIVKGATGEQRGRWKLGGVPDYPMLSAGQCTDIPGVDDGANFKTTWDAMEVVGITPEDREAVFRVVAGVLHLQTVQFGQDDKDQAVVKNTDKLALAAEMFQVDSKLLGEALISFTTGKEKIRKVLNANGAQTTRESVNRLLYDKTFSWIVGRINDTTSKESESVNFIGLLDIFGFEDFTVNSFEQLCINLANEQLQCHYNEYTFEKDVEECRGEGINVESVSFASNKDCVELMSDKLGVLGMLDDECSLGTATDKGFLDKLDGAHGEKGKKNPYYKKDRVSVDKFMIKHYAGTVTYTITSWIEKNRDSIKDDVRNCFGSSTCPFVKALVPPPNEEKKGKDPTVGGIFRSSLQSLMAVINSTKPNWIRCIKPHPAKKPKMFSNLTVLEQLTSAGVIETIKMRKAGFAYRIPFDQFYEKFFCFLPSKPSDKTNLSPACGDILKIHAFPSDQAQIGKTKVFLRIPAYLKLDEARDAIMAKFTFAIQQFARAKISMLVKWRKYFVIAVKTVQFEIREYLKVSAASRVEKERLKKELAERAGKDIEKLLVEQAAAYDELVKEMEEGYGVISAYLAEQKLKMAAAEQEMLVKSEEFERAKIESEEENTRLDYEEDFWMEAGAIVRKLRAMIEKRNAERQEQKRKMCDGEEQARDNIMAEEEAERDFMYEDFAPIIRAIWDEIEYKKECKRRRQKKIARLHQLRIEEEQRLFEEQEAEMAERRKALAYIEKRKDTRKGAKHEKRAQMAEHTAEFADIFHGEKSAYGIDKRPVGVTGGRMRFDEYAAHWKHSYYIDKHTKMKTHQMDLKYSMSIRDQLAL